MRRVANSNQSPSKLLTCLSTRKARVCFALIIVNVLLIVGISISVARRLNAPPDLNNSRNASSFQRKSNESIKLQKSMNTNIQAFLELENHLNSIKH